MIGEPVIEFRNVEKALGESFPLRINAFTLRRNERVVLSGLPGSMGEAFMHLIVGASLPDAGEVIVCGANTRDIRTDTEWLTSLDRFGLVSHRAVLLDQSTIAQNLALPITLAIDPMSAGTRAKVEALAREVELPAAVLDHTIAAATAEAEARIPNTLPRVDIHLARALAHDPQVLLLEHPTLGPHGASGYAFGAKVRRIADDRQLSFVAVSDDDMFARETGAQRLRVERDGRIRPAGFSLLRMFGWSRP